MGKPSFADVRIRGEAQEGRILAIRPDQIGDRNKPIETYSGSGADMVKTGKPSGKRELGNVG